MPNPMGVPVGAIQDAITKGIHKISGNTNFCLEAAATILQDRRQRSIGVRSPFHAPVRPWTPSTALQRPARRSISPPQHNVITNQ
jgi:hypothetical protein